VVDEPKKKSSAMAQLLMYAVVASNLVNSLIVPGIDKAAPESNAYGADIIRFHGHATTLLELASKHQIDDVRECAAAFVLMAFVELLKRYEQRLWDALPPSTRTWVAAQSMEVLAEKVGAFQKMTESIH